MWSVHLQRPQEPILIVEIKLRHQRQALDVDGFEHLALQVIRHRLRQVAQQLMEVGGRETQAYCITQRDYVSLARGALLPRAALEARLAKEVRLAQTHLRYERRCHSGNA